MQKSEQGATRPVRWSFRRAGVVTMFVFTFSQSAATNCACCPGVGASSGGHQRLYIYPDFSLPSLVHNSSLQPFYLHVASARVKRA